eukprot:TRINITY_DN52017_c0_g1_i1.p3 TRINITY_DN52017_c0_g1~~TRINITY_DN52017_c0_g1_i1.p3  ORF type:complete len:121 (+),score=6.47 TRINITY_DN52017_c0_g1_i1:59-421(+)
MRHPLHYEQHAPPCGQVASSQPASAQTGASQQVASRSSQHDAVAVQHASVSQQTLVSQQTSPRSQHSAPAKQQLLPFDSGCIAPEVANESPSTGTAIREARNFQVMVFPCRLIEEIRSKN